MTRSSSFSRHLSHHWRKFSGNVSGNFQPGVPIRISLDSKQCRRVTAAVSFSITDYKLSRYFCVLLLLDQKHRPPPPVLNVFMKWTKRSTDDGRHVLQSRAAQPVCVKPTSLTVGEVCFCRSFFYGNEALTANPIWVLPLKVFSLWNLHVSPPRVCVDFLWKLQFLAGLVRYKKLQITFRCRCVNVVSLIKKQEPFSFSSIYFICKKQVAVEWFHSFSVFILPLTPSVCAVQLVLLIWPGGKLKHLRTVLLHNYQLMCSGQSREQNKTCFRSKTS